MDNNANMASRYEHEIPEGYEARIEGNKVIIELKESEDERIRKWCISHFRECFRVTKDNVEYKEYLNNKVIPWLEKQGDKAFSVERVFAEAGIKPAYKDGNSWCVLIGENIQEGICGFGETPKDAYVNFLKELWNMAFQTPVRLKPEYKPKFKVGDFVLHGKKNIIFQVEKTFLDKTYRIVPVNADMRKAVTSATEDTLRLWTIQDAKDGDMLANGEMIVMFKHFEEPSYRQHIVAYIGLDTMGNIQITDDTWILGIDKAKPATKEQRDLLFQKMREAGYEWDAEKKELREIEEELK